MKGRRPKTKCPFLLSKQRSINPQHKAPRLANTENHKIKNLDPWKKRSKITKRINLKEIDKVKQVEKNHEQSWVFVEEP